MLLFISCHVWYVLSLAPGFNTSHVTLYRCKKITGITGYSFQYISCYSLSSSADREEYLYKFVSIHLMLLFIRICPLNRRIPVWVSIHLMLLFILQNGLFILDFWVFQYISCYSLSLSVTSSGNPNLVSIHLMLLFIQKRIVREHVQPGFQYISCYSLSAALAISVWSYTSFNTSHVTLYPLVL